MGSFVLKLDVIKYDKLKFKIIKFDKIKFEIISLCLSSKKIMFGDDVTKVSLEN